MNKFFLLFAILFTNICVSQDLSLGLTAYYPFSGSANDVSGNNNNPGFNNATLTEDRQMNPNSAYHFNGINNYIQIANSPTLNFSNQISLCAWVRVTGFYTGPCHGNSVLMKGDIEHFPGNYLLRFDDNFYTDGANCSTSIIDTVHQNFYGRNANAGFPGYTPFIEANQWQSVVYTYDGTTARLYINCELKVTEVSTLAFTNSYDLFFGKFNSPSYPYWLNGDLDEIRLYNRPLTQDEVSLYGDCIIVPVKLTAFNTSVINDKSILLTWHTEEEAGITAYNIERSVTGADFIPIATVSAKGTVSAGNYSYIDHTAEPNRLYYYRVGVIENNTVRKYTATKTAKIQNRNFYSLIYPNPTKDIVKINLFNPVNQTDIRVFNNLGQVVIVEKSYSLNSNTVSVDLSKVASGSYWISIQNGDNRTVEKIIKE